MAVLGSSTQFNRMVSSIYVKETTFLLNRQCTDLIDDDHSKAKSNPYIFLHNIKELNHPNRLSFSVTNHPKREKWGTF